MQKNFTLSVLNIIQPINVIIKKVTLIGRDFFESTRYFRLTQE